MYLYRIGYGINDWLIVDQYRLHGSLTGGLTYPCMSVKVRKSIVQRLKDEITIALNALLAYSIECTANIRFGFITLFELDVLYQFTLW